MATWDDIRAVARSLPGVQETHFHGEPWFTVGSRGFVQGWRGRVVMKLDKDHEAAVRGAPRRVLADECGAAALEWVDVEALNAREVADLVREAWTQVVPKRVSQTLAFEG